MSTSTGSACWLTWALLRAAGGRADAGVLLGEVAQWPLQLTCRLHINGTLVADGLTVGVNRYLQPRMGLWTYKLAGLGPQVGLRAVCCRACCLVKVHGAMRGLMPRPGPVHQVLENCTDSWQLSHLPAWYCHHPAPAYAAAGHAALPAHAA